MHTRLLCRPRTHSHTHSLTLPPQTLYESSVAFGMRKALLGEQGKGEMESRIEGLEAETRDLSRQVGLFQ